MGVSLSGALGSGVVLIVSLSAMLFMFPSKNSSVFSFIPDDRKWASGEMSEGAVVKVAEGAATKKSSVWGGFIVKGDEFVGSVVCGVVVHIADFMF